MAAIEGAADIQVQFDCIACGESWTERLDVVGYVWEEIAERARRLLDEVHGLAAHYGWSEQRNPLHERRATRRLSRAVLRVSGYLRWLAAQALGRSSGVRPVRRPPYFAAALPTIAPPIDAVESAPRAPLPETEAAAQLLAGRPAGAGRSA